MAEEPCAPPGLKLKMQPWVFGMSWCADFEFRGTLQGNRSTGIYDVLAPVAWRRPALTWPSGWQRGIEGRGLSRGERSPSLRGPCCRVPQGNGWWRRLMRGRWASWCVICCNNNKLCAKSFVCNKRSIESNKTNPRSQPDVVWPQIQQTVTGSLLISTQAPRIPPSHIPPSRYDARPLRGSPLRGSLLFPRDHPEQHFQQPCEPTGWPHPLWLQKANSNRMLY